MKKLLATVLVVGLVGGAFAQGPDYDPSVFNQVGLFWAPTGEEPVLMQENTNIDFPMGVEVWQWFVILNPAMEEIKTFEARYRILYEGTLSTFAGDPVPENDGVWFPVGSQSIEYRNFQIVYVGGFIPADPAGTLLAKLPLTSFASIPMEFQLNGFAPTIGEPMVNPRIFDGNDQPWMCTLTIDDELRDSLGWGTVATANGDGIIATEDLTLTNVKALFR